MSALLAAGLLGVAAGPAQADDVFYFGDGLGYEDDGGDNSNVAINASRTQIVITAVDGDAIDDASVVDECTGDGTAVLTCVPDGGEFFGYYAFMDDGNDVLTLDGELGGDAFGDDGDDIITGSDTNGRGELLSGNAGNDQLNARNVGTVLPVPIFTDGDGFGDPSIVGDDLAGGDGNDSLLSGTGHDFAAGDGEALFLAGRQAYTRNNRGADGFGEGDAPGTDVVSTGAGDDFGFGGSGNGDQVNLGDGDDFTEFDEGDGTGDTLDGGSGIDELDIDEDDESPENDELAPNANVNLATGAVAAGADTATALNFEDLFTEEGADTVVGNAASNLIDTYLGNDVVNPGDGADTVFLDPDAFAFVAARGEGDGGFPEGPTPFGNDVADLADGFGDRVQCGPGVDTITADQFDTVASDCEAVTRVERRAGGADLIAPDCTLSKVKSRYGRTAFLRGFNVAVTCSEGANVTIQLLAKWTRKLFTARAGDVVLAQKTATVGAGTASTVKVRPAKKFRKRLRKKGFRVRLNVEASDQYGNRSVEPKTVRVKKVKTKRKRRR